MVMSNWPALKEMGIVRRLPVTTGDQVRHGNRFNIWGELTAEVVRSAIVYAGVVVLEFITVVPFTESRSQPRNNRQS